MKENEKANLIAEAENVEAIRDFFIEWYSVEELYETLAKACTCIIHLSNKNLIGNEDKEVFSKLVNQHELMIEYMKPFVRKEESV